MGTPNNEHIDLNNLSLRELTILNCHHLKEVKTTVEGLKKEQIKQGRSISVLNSAMSGSKAKTNIALTAVCSLVVGLILLWIR